MSAFLRASHRLRSMSLVSGYLLSQKGSLIARITQRKDGEEVSKWISVMNAAEINVRFHQKFRRYLLEIVSSDEATAFAPPSNFKKGHRVAGQN